MTIRLPKDRLAEDRHLRHAQLREYFCDRDASASLDGGGWSLDLHWPDDPYRHVDPGLTKHLAAWDCGLGNMAHAVRRQGRVTTALYDTWTLVSWARWAAASKVRSDAALTILHVDDHRDLMAPRLMIDPDRWRDPITGAHFDFRDPASVVGALESGAVGMGSFLTPVLHAFPNAEVRHLCQPPKAPDSQSFRIELGTMQDDLLEPGALRPAVTLTPSGERGPGSYLLTPDIGDWLDGVGGGPVLLHIDMDYFNNRYDGDGDWAERRHVLDPDQQAVMDRIRSVSAAIRTSGLLPRIEDAVVAYSPGFFPSEFWAESEQTLRQTLGELYG